MEEFAEEIDLLFIVDKQTLPDFLEENLDNISLNASTDTLLSTLNQEMFIR